MEAHDLKTRTELTNKPLTANDQKQKPLVVVGEDELAVQHCIKLQLEPYFRLQFFTTAEAMLVYMRGHASAIELVILDYMLPGMNGLQLLSIMKQDHSLKHLRVILQSGMCKAMLNTENVKPDFYLEKPWTHQQMLSAVENVLDLQIKF